MAVTRTCVLDGCEATFTVRPSDMQKYCSAAHARDAVPAYADSPEAARTCARDGCDEAFRVRWPSDIRRFCTHACSTASRRQETCVKCDGNDWLVKPNGRRTCRTCRARAAAARAARGPARRRTTPDGRRVVVTPPPVATSALPLPPPRPLWRPNAPGWPIRPGDEAA